MKFTCSQGALTRALNTVSKAVSIRTTIPILKGILLTVKGNELTVTASDLDLSIETKMEVQAAEEGSAVVSSKLFSEIVRKLPNAVLQIEEADGKMEISCLGSHFSIVSLPADEFPAIGMVNQLSKIGVKKDSLKDLIKKTTFAASIDEKKGILVGCLLKFAEGKLEMAALDGFRLAVANCDMPSEEEKSVVIPARILAEIQKILMESSEEEEVSLVLDDKKAEIITKETRIVARLLEGEFIKYNDIIPKTYKTRCLVNREELLSIARQIEDTLKNQLFLKKVCKELQALCCLCGLFGVLHGALGFCPSVHGKGIGIARFFLRDRGRFGGPVRLVSGTRDKRLGTLGGLLRHLDIIQRIVGTFGLLSFQRGLGRFVGGFRRFIGKLSGGLRAHQRSLQRCDLCGSICLLYDLIRLLFPLRVGRRSPYGRKRKALRQYQQKCDHSAHGSGTPSVI